MPQSATDTPILGTHFSINRRTCSRINIDETVRMLKPEHSQAIAEYISG